MIGNNYKHNMMYGKRWHVHRISMQYSVNNTFMDDYRLNSCVYILPFENSSQAHRELSIVSQMLGAIFVRDANHQSEFKLSISCRI